MFSAQLGDMGKSLRKSRKKGSSSLFCSSFSLKLCTLAGK